MRLLTHDSRLTARQVHLLDGWMPGARLERDHSWDLGIRAVLEVTWSGQRFIVKAGTDQDHHMAREIRAHQEWLAPWTSTDRAPRMIHADPEAHVLVTAFLPGELVLGNHHAHDPAVFEQAGELLSALHGQEAVTDPDAEARENERSLRWLDGQHRISPESEAALRAEIAAWPTPPAVLVPTHGDWQPRNWLVHEGRVAVIDFGRAGLRPAMTDFTRLAAQDFARAPHLEAAFLRGYGPDPREPGAWHRAQVREAIGTAVWAHQVGDEDFEAQGHAMIRAALAGRNADDNH